MSGGNNASAMNIGMNSSGGMYNTSSKLNFGMTGNNGLSSSNSSIGGNGGTLISNA